MIVVDSNGREHDIDIDGMCWADCRGCADAATTTVSPDALPSADRRAAADAPIARVCGADDVQSEGARR